VTRLPKNRSVDPKLREACRLKGLKATRQRLEILKIVFAARNHPSADLIYKQVKSRIPGISFDTVYRTLSSFEEHKLVTRVHHFGDRTRYDPNTGEHHHFVCIRCKKISDFDWPEFAQLKLPFDGSKSRHIIQKYVEVRGLCPKCAENS